MIRPDPISDGAAPLTHGLPLPPPLGGLHGCVVSRREGTSRSICCHWRTFSVPVTVKPTQGACHDHCFVLRPIFSMPPFHDTLSAVPPISRNEGRYLPHQRRTLADGGDLPEAPLNCARHHCAPIHSSQALTPRELLLRFSLSSGRAGRTAGK